MTALTRWLVIMVKNPVAGRVKTRLAGDIGAADAVRVYRAIANTLIQRLLAPRQWQVILAVDPDHAAATRAFPPQLPRIGQGSGDLGLRMQKLMSALPRGPVVIIGSDCPGIARHHIRDAFNALGRTGAVVGPAPDGGYWMIGLARRFGSPVIFEGVRWSSSDALEDTLKNIHRLGLTVSTLAELPDIDDAASLKSASHLVGRRLLPVTVPGQRC